MSSPIQKPKGIYSHPPEGRLISCPHCNKILNQHLSRPVPSLKGIDANRNEFEKMGKVVDLFELGSTSEMEEKIKQAVEEASLEAQIEAGDIYVPQIPEIVREFEQVQTGQARPEKQERMVAPGAKPKPIPPKPSYNAGSLEVMDHPIIGGKVTICVLLYGEDHHALHRRCLTSICEIVPPSRMDLRVACNQIGLETENYLKTLPITKIYRDYKNRRKYPAMRQMFWDSKDPIETKYVIWFDDDSYALNKDWMSILCQVIVNQKPRDKVGMYGCRMMHPLQQMPNRPDPRDWFRSAPWFKGKEFQNKRGAEVPGGQNIHFAVGGFWAISLECLKACDIPDTRLSHNGGDICIGCQVWQNNFKIKMFNEKKQYIKTSGAPRRGFRERFPYY